MYEKRACMSSAAIDAGEDLFLRLHKHDDSTEEGAYLCDYPTPKQAFVGCQLVCVCGDGHFTVGHQTTEDDHQ